MDITDIASNSNLYLKDGIWFARNNRKISYSEDGNMNCFQIEKNSFWFEHRNNCIVEAVKKYSRGETFFDIGGGNGFVSKGLEENNIQTVLIEPGIQGALNARNAGIKNIICSTFEDAGLKVNSCKSIGLFDVVEHIEDDDGFLKSINKILADKGLVYITVPAYKMLWSKEDNDAGHFRRYTTSSIGRKLQNSGFEIEYATYIFSILPIPIFLFRTIPSFLGFNRNSNDFKKHQKEHSKSKGIMASLIDRIWQTEVNCIKRKKRILLGGSCFIIARKR